MRTIKIRNQQICETFYQQYGTMPTMTLYTLIGKAFDLSEESVRKIVKAEIKNKNNGQKKKELGMFYQQSQPKQTTFVASFESIVSNQ